MEHKDYKKVNRAHRKSIDLLLGKPIYTHAVVPEEALVVKLMQSLYTNALIINIDTVSAKAVPGVVDNYTR